MGTWSDDEKFREREREVAFNLGVQSCDAEIAQLKGEVERLRLRSIACDVVDCVTGWIACEGDEGTTSRRPCRGCIVGYRNAEALHQHALAAHKRALAAGPAALVYRSCSCCWLVERAQEAAMKEGK